ncbi:hypothetical protein JCM15764A_05160 [Geotalea toluenoxydans]
MLSKGTVKKIYNCKKSLHLINVDLLSALVYEGKQVLNNDKRLIETANPRVTRGRKATYPG